MAQDTTTLDQDTKNTAVEKDNLVSLQGSGNEKQVMEINRQMTNLEGSIARLTKKLNAANKQIGLDVERLASSDAEITEKVADTYRQLGIIDSGFNALSKQSKKITADLKKVNNTVQAFETASNQALSEAIDNQLAVNEEFKSQHEEIIERAEKLSRKATTISTKLNKSIKDSSKALTELEAKIISELETVAQSSQQRDEDLDTKINSSNDEINSQKANMLLLQSVDEALDKRALALEKTSQLLISDSEDLKQSTQELNSLTAKLSSKVEALEIHTAQLAQQNSQQQGEIENLSDKTSSLTRTLLALAVLEKKHFRMVSATGLLLLLAVIAVFFYSEYMRETEQSVEAQRNSFINEQVSTLQDTLEDEQMASKVFYSEIIELQQKTEQLHQQVQEMNDEVESLDGRVQYLAPLYNFGSDNTIHGSQWLSKLDENKMSIKIATVTDRQSLYDIAQRYNHYFTEDLGYFVTDDNQFTLIYGGNFADEQQISDTLRRMPSYMDYQLITAISNAEILQQISE